MRVTKPYRQLIIRGSIGAGVIALTTLLMSSTPREVEAQRGPSTDESASRFVADLLAKMTLDEKLGQMTQISWKEPHTISHDDRVKASQVGSFLFVSDPAEIDRLQHIAVEQSRLHIPLIFGFDVIHGYHTIFPIPLGLAASWNPEMVESVQSAAAAEASAGGINWAFAPMVDIARDPRWGRIIEGAGEDPYLGSKIAAAQVRGFQGATLGSPGHILACVKHFAGYGAAEGGRDYDEANISDEQLNNVYLPPFHAAVQAGVGCLMPAYMDLNGIPATANTWLLQDVLRKQWGFKGFVVSDWQTVPALVTHGLATSNEDAAIRAVNAGVQMEMTSSEYRDTLGAAVKSGAVPIAVIDSAVRDILTVKYKLGLFSHPYAVATNAAAPREAARKAAEQSAVLLRNESGALPLKRTASVALIGPLADSKIDMTGSWSLASKPLAGQRDEAVTILEGLRKKLGDAQVHYAKGVEIERGSSSIFDEQYPEAAPTLTTQALKDNAFADAIAAVKASDVAVLVLGEVQNMNGEAASRSSLSLPGRQEELLEAAVATGKPVVLVLVNGRPLDISWASQHANAILEAWYPGTEGGDAVANLLVGDANPGGKLPVTWPRSVGQIPIYYARNLTQNPNDDAGRYWDAPNTPLYRFGFGLSYATFHVGPVQLDAEQMRTDGEIHAKVMVENTSGVAGDEVVQLYTHQRAGSASRPRRELKGFVRVHLAAGEKREVTLELKAAELAFWSPATHRTAVEPGVFDVWVGADSAAAERATFKVVQ